MEELYVPLQSATSNMSQLSGQKDYFGYKYNNKSTGSTSSLPQSPASPSSSSSSAAPSPSLAFDRSLNPLHRSEGPAQAFARRPSTQRSVSQPSMAAAKSTSSSSPATPSYQTPGKFTHRDIIDQLDFSSTLFSSGVHHDGPFDAASSHRNRADARRPAPMAAFQDPAGGPSSSSRHARPVDLASSGNTTAPDGCASSTLTLPTDEREYLPGLTADGAADSSHSSSSMAHRSVHLGYPAPHFHERRDSASGRSPSTKEERRREASRAKAAAYAEAFGLQDQEAWEDYGRSHYAKEAPRESVYELPKSPGSKMGLSTAAAAAGATAKDDPSLAPVKPTRAERHASVWDMEATLKAGVPVASAPPPVPAIPPAFANAASSSGTSSNSLSASTSSSNPPKRSKSLLNRMGRHKNKDSSASASGVMLASSGSSYGSGSSSAGKKPNLVISAPEIIHDNSESISAPADMPLDWKDEKTAQMQSTQAHRSSPSTSRQQSPVQSRASPLGRSVVAGANTNNSTPPRGHSLRYNDRPRPKATPPPVGPSFDDVMLGHHNSSSSSNSLDAEAAGRESVTFDMLNDLGLDDHTTSSSGHKSDSDNKRQSRQLSPSNSKSDKLSRSTSLLRRLRGKH